ncbi:MAG: hypothetical protein Q4F72_12090, partial [Desulfovibrionaceae bacterium]|nr:hypothetical protein [Desulfovibrionaceae bacterium]
MTPRDSGARDGARTARAAGSGKSRAADERQPEGRASEIVRRRPERKADDMVRETARSARPERPEKAGAAERIETPETAGQDVRTGEAGQGPKAVIVRRGSPSRSRLDRGAKSGRARADEALPESQPADYAGVAAALRAADGVQVPAADGTGPGSMADAYEKAAGGADAADAALEAAEKEPDDEDGDASSDSEAILEDNP